MNTDASQQDWVPVDACTLPTVDRPMRLAELDDLFSTSLREVDRGVGAEPRARLVLTGEATLPERVQRLADAETGCCSFFTFTVTRLDALVSGRDTVVALDIEVPPARVDVLDALVARADRVRQVQR